MPVELDETTSEVHRENHRSAKWWYWLVGVVVVLVALTIQVRSILSEPPPINTITLPGGDKLVLREVQYDRRLAMGDRMQIYYEKLPVWLQRALPKPQYPASWSSGRSPILGMWIDYHGPGSRPPADIEFYLGNEEGVFAGRRMDRRRVEDPRPELSHYFAKTGQLPKRSNSLRLGVFRRTAPTEWQKLGEFKFRNPAPPGDELGWNADQLPATSPRDADIVLHRLAYGVGTNDFFQADPETTISALAAFEIGDQGAARNDWTVVSVWMEDGVGQIVHALPRFDYVTNSMSGTTNLVRWHPVIWPDDRRGIRFRFEFTRTPIAKFKAKELLHLKGVVVPSATDVTVIGQTTNMLSRKVHVVGHAGIDGVFPSFKKQPVDGLSLQLKVSSPFRRSSVHLVAVQDETGKAVPFEQSKLPRYTGRYAFKISPGTAKTVDLTLAFHRSRLVQFVVEPEALKP